MREGRQSTVFFFFCLVIRTGMHSRPSAYARPVSLTLVVVQQMGAAEMHYLYLKGLVLAPSASAHLPQKKKGTFFRVSLSDGTQKWCTVAAAVQVPPV